MNPLPDETPIEEYERRLAEQCCRAQRLVYICYAVTCIPYVATWVAALWPGDSLWMLTTAFGVTISFGVATGIVTLWKWPFLTWRDRLFGLAPWLYFALTSWPIVLTTTW